MPWLAAIATRRAKGSGGRLFLLVYVVGTIVTAFLSNDATAVREICEAAGITKPTLYHFYGSKEGVLQALVTSGFVRFRRLVDSAMAPSPAHLYFLVMPRS